MTSFMILSIIAVTIVFTAIPHIIWLIAWLIAKCFHFSMPYMPFLWSAICLLVIVWAIFAYGYFVGRLKLEITKIDFPHNELPASFNNYKIVHISDLHLSTFDDKPEALQKVVDSINAQNPDIVCFTGDLVSLGASEAEPFASILQQIHAPDGVFSVLGNHDFMIYRHKHEANFDREAEVKHLAELQRKDFGWHLLRNANYKIHRGSEFITILGVDNQNCSNQGFKTISRGDLKKAMNGTYGFRILLTHDPSHWREEVVAKTDIPLTLCGHTHAAQIRIFGFTPASWTFNDTDGLYHENDQAMYINVGIGCTLPLRLGANPEITVITLKCK